MSTIKSPLQVSSVVFLGVCLVASSWLISDAIKNLASIQIPESKVSTNKYEFIPISDNHYIILDTETGTYLEKKEHDEEWTTVSP